MFIPTPKKMSMNKVYIEMVKDALVDFEEEN